jgi:hypothetical protein
MMQFFNVDVSRLDNHEGKHRWYDKNYLDVKAVLPLKPLSNFYPEYLPLI